MKLRKLTPLLIILTVLCVSLVNGLGDYLGGYDSSNDGGHYEALSATHPTDSASLNSATGQTVNFTTDYYIGTVMFYCKFAYTSMDNGTYEARIYNNTGAYGSTAEPSTDDGHIAASTNSISEEGITATTSNAWYSFNFSNVLLTAGNYTIAMVCSDRGINNSAVVLRVCADSSTPTESGNVARYINSAWAADATHDLIYMLYDYNPGDFPTPTPTPTASPTPSPSPTPTPAPTTYTGAYSYLIAFIICIIPAIIGFLTVGPWGFLIGLNVGVALGITSFGSYVPVWAGLVMAVMDVAALLTSGLGGKDGIK